MPPHKPPKKKQGFKWWTVFGIQNISVKNPKSSTVQTSSQNIFVKKIRGENPQKPSIITSQKKPPSSPPFGLTRVTHFVAMRLFFSTKVMRRHKSCPARICPDSLGKDEAVFVTGNQNKTVLFLQRSVKHWGVFFFREKKWRKDFGFCFVWIEDVGNLKKKWGGCSLSTAKTVEASLVLPFPKLSCKAADGFCWNFRGWIRCAKKRYLFPHPNGAGLVLDDLVII